MKVDYHVHLEEGPYSLSFVERTLKAIEHFEPIKGERHTKEWLIQSMNTIANRLSETEYSKWWLDLYLQEALNKGLKEVGIVDHLYRFKETRDYFRKYMDLESKTIGVRQLDWLNKVMVRNFDEFITMIDSAKEEWERNGVTLRLGIEADYFAGGEKELSDLLSKYQFDYVIGSVHFYNGWGFDNPELQEKFQEYDLVELYKNHFETVKKAARSGLFDIVAHLDNLKVFNYRPNEDLLIDSYKEVAQALVEMDVATEINPGLYYRYPVKEMCPSSRFIDILVDYGVLFTTSSDSHFPNDIGIFSDQIKNMLLERNVSKVATFKNRQRIMKPFHLEANNAL
jgi:histidinol-phosphatase (PHP family)